MAVLQAEKAISAPDKGAQPSKFTVHVGSLLLLLYVACLAVGAILLFRPRAVLPGAGVILPRAPLDRPALSADDDKALSVLRTPDAARVRTVFRQAAIAEAQAVQGTLTSDERDLKGGAKEAVRTLQQAVGEDAVALLRDQMTHEITTAVLQGKRAEGIVGAFPTHLERYGAFREARLVAPPPVVAALAKARWNAIAGRELLDGFQPEELRSYWGWLAFHARGAEAERRLDALDAFEAAGGTAPPDLRALLLARLGSPLEAANLMDIAYQQSSNLRLRNHALALVQLASAEESVSP